MPVNPLVSVIIPVYNVRLYLKESLECILNQSYQNLEILIIDDGSDDGCGEICDAYARKDPRVRVFHQENMGLSAARNAGLDRMTGDLVAFLDSDDIFHQNMIQSMTNVLLQNRADIAVCRFCEGKAAGNLHFRVKCRQTKKRLLTSKESLRALIDGKLSQAVWSKLYTQAIWKDIRFPDGCVYEDVWVTYRLLEQAERIVYIDDTLIYHRNRPYSITTTFSVKYMQDWFSAINHMEKYVEVHTPELFTEEQKKIFYERNLRAACLKCSKMMLSDSSENWEFKTAIRSEILSEGRIFERHFHSFKTGAAYYLFKYCPFLLPYVQSCFHFGKHLLGKDLT